MTDLKDGPYKLGKSSAWEITCLRSVTCAKMFDIAVCSVSDLFCQLLSQLVKQIVQLVSPGLLYFLGAIFELGGCA